MKLKTALLVALLALLTVPASASVSNVSDKLAVMAIMGEASNQGFEGMVAVGEAIRNRGSLKGVYGVKSKHIYRDSRYVWDSARKAWQASKTSNLVKGADHWENIKAFGKPKWADEMLETARIRDHVFYRSA